MYPQFVRDSRYHKSFGEAQPLTNRNPNYITPATLEDDYTYGKADESYAKNVDQFDRELSKLGFKSIFDVQTPAWSTEKSPITTKNGLTQPIQSRNDQVVSGSDMSYEVKGQLASQDIQMVISAIRAIRAGNIVLAEEILGREINPADMASANSFPTLRPVAESEYGETIRGFYPSESLKMKRYIESLKRDGIDYSTKEDPATGLTYVVSDVSGAIGSAISSVVPPPAIPQAPPLTIPSGSKGPSRDVLSLITGYAKTPPASPTPAPAPSKSVKLSEIPLLNTEEIKKAEDAINAEVAYRNAKNPKGRKLIYDGSVNESSTIQNLPEESVDRLLNAFFPEYEKPTSGPKAREKQDVLKDLLYKSRKDIMRKAVMAHKAKLAKGDQATSSTQGQGLRRGRGLKKKVYW